MIGFCIGFIVGAAAMFVALWALSKVYREQ